MPFLPLLLGAATTAGVIGLIAIAAAATGYHLQTFSILFIIPVGGIAAGIGCGAGMFYGLILNGRRPQKLDYLISVGLALAGFVGVYLGLYLSTYVTPNGEVNHTFQGDHISTFTYKDTGEPVTFLAYLLRDIASRQSTFFVGSRRIHVPVGTFHMPSAYNWAKFGLEGLGFLIGGVVVGWMLIGDRKYCERCQRYMKDKRLFTILPEQYEDKSTRLNAALQSGHDLRALIDSEQAVKTKEGHVQVAMSYCPTCYNGFLMLKVMRKTSDGFDEAQEHRQTIGLAGTVTREVVLAPPVRSRT